MRKNKEVKKIRKEKKNKMIPNGVNTALYELK